MYQCERDISGTRANYTPMLEEYTRQKGQNMSNVRGIYKAKWQIIQQSKNAGVVCLDK